MEKRTLYCLDLRRHHPARIFIHHLVIQNSVPLMSGKGYSFINLHSTFSHDAKADHLSSRLEGELFTDETTRILYATDASAYREMPLAVAVPKSVEDLKTLISICPGKSDFPDSPHRRHFSGRSGSGKWHCGGCFQKFYKDS